MYVYELIECTNYSGQVRAVGLLTTIDKAMKYCEKNYSYNGDLPTFKKSIPKSI